MSRTNLAAELAGQLAANPAIVSEVNGANHNGNGTAAAPEPLLISMEAIEEQKVEWLWLNRVPVGRITMIDGDPGIGKSFLSLALAAAVSKGEALPSGAKPSGANIVLLMSVEDGFGDTVKPRLRKLGAKMANIVIPNPKRGLPPTLLNAVQIEEMVNDSGPALLIIDPIIAFVGRKDTDKAAQVRELLSPLVEMAERRGLAVVIIRHLNKGNSKALYRGMGSIDFMAACRSAFIIAEDPEEPTRRILAHVKSSLGPKSPSLSFYLDGDGFRWGEEVAISAEEILEASQQPRTKERERNQLKAACDFLHETLDAGAALSKDIFDMAANRGISKATCFRAKTELGIQAVKGRGPAGEWSWHLNGSNG